MNLDITHYVLIIIETTDCMVTHWRISQYSHEDSQPGHSVNWVESAYDDDGTSKKMEMERAVRMIFFGDEPEVWGPLEAYSQQY